MDDFDDFDGDDFLAGSDNDEFDYDDFIENEFGEGQQTNVPTIWKIAAATLLVAFILLCLVAF